MDNEINSRYSVIEEKNKREIVLLRGSGCTWRKCRFCDYHLDSSRDQIDNYERNRVELKKVTGIYSKLEVINSGSFTELSSDTMNLIQETCLQNQIKELHFECHWNNRDAVKPLKEHFRALGITVIIKIGVESFDYLFRESYFSKGIDEEKPENIAKYFDECCLLLGVPGQTVESMIWEIETGLEHFQRVCVNIMQENGMPIKPDPRVIEHFATEVYPKYKDNIRVDILMENTAFGVGGVTTNAK